MGSRRSQYWSVAETNYDEEFRAAHHIERKGHRYYLPQIMAPVAVGRRGRQRIVERRQFLFPGYIFVRIAGEWKTMLSTRGIRRMFLSDMIPAPVPDADIEDMVAREDSRGFVRLRPQLQVGQRIVVREPDGKKLMDAIFAGDAPLARCKVLFSILGRQGAGTVDERLVAVAA